MIGTILNDKYQIKSILAESTAFEIYLAIEAETGTEVVVKILREEFAKISERVAAFSDEVKTFTKLSHPALAQVMDFDLWEGRPFLVSERIEGADMRSVIKGGELTFEAVLQVVGDIGELLFHAYEQGVSPRYLKQSNILRSTTGKTRVLSFSLPRLKLVGAADSDFQVGVQSDLFFLGTLFFELLAGESPIRRRGGINEHWDTKLIQAMRVRFEHLEPSLIDKVVAMIEKTFTREVGKRHTDHLDFFKSLNELKKLVRKLEGAGMAPKRKAFSTASEVVDAIHGRLPEALDAQVALLSNAGSPAVTPAIFSQDATFSQGNTALAAATADPLPADETSTRPAFKVLKGGRSGQQSIWRSADEHSWYRNPMVMMGVGITLMVILILFW